MAEDFQARVRRAREDLVRMGRSVGARFTKTMDVLDRRDAEAALPLVEADKETDRQELAIERECLDILAAAPKGSVNTNVLVAILKIDSDVERVGDMAANLAERVPGLAGLEAPGLPGRIFEMGRIAGEMFSDAVDAVAGQDLVLARRIIERDDAIDEMNEEAYRRLLDEIATEPERLEHAMHGLVVSKTLERIADLATKIAKNLVFMVTGEIARHQGRKHQG